MLTLLLGVGLVWLLWLIWRHATQRPCPVWIGLLVALLAWGGAIEWRWRAMEDRYSQTAQRVLDRPEVRVHCQRMSGAMFNVFNRLGYVKYNADGSLPSNADLTWETCRHLRAWEASGGTSTEQDHLVALHVLSHEIQHLAGHTSEALTECYAIQYDAQVATVLGAPSDAAFSLADRYYQVLYPRMRDDYRSSECIPGGEMDLNPQTEDWPTG